MTAAKDVSFRIDGGLLAVLHDRESNQVLMRIMADGSSIEWRMGVDAALSVAAALAAAAREIKYG